VALLGCPTAPQVFNVFNRVLGFFMRSGNMTFDDDWETKSDYAAEGLRLLRCVACVCLSGWRLSVCRGCATPHDGGPQWV
jgi:hypothetical protein